MKLFYCYYVVFLFFLSLLDGERLGINILFFDFILLNFLDFFGEKVGMFGSLRFESVYINEKYIYNIC